MSCSYKTKHGECRKRTSAFNRHLRNPYNNSIQTITEENTSTSENPVEISKPPTIRFMDTNSIEINE